jgi:hypothetical protein
MYQSVDRFKELAYRRVGQKRLAAHLEDVHGIDLAGVTELDVGVFRVARNDGPSWWRGCFLRRDR